MSKVGLTARVGRCSLATVLVSAVMLVVGPGQGSAYAAVTAVKGSAFGYHGDVLIFGSLHYVRGPAPTVTLAPHASRSLQAARAESGSVIAGPAVIFSSGPIRVTTSGSLGARGSVSSSTSIDNVNASGQEVFTAANLASTCSASETGVRGFTRITDGTLQIDSGDDHPVNEIPDHPQEVVTLPTNPAPNTEYMGHIHVGNITDSFRYVFNEQTITADGSITVNAAHLYLLGPLATGDVIIGQSVCGAST